MEVKLILLHTFSEGFFIYGIFFSPVATYGKNCSISQLIVEQCGQNEMCKQGWCDCTPRYPLCARTGLCQTIGGYM